MEEAGGADGDEQAGLSPVPATKRTPPKPINFGTCYCFVEPALGRALPNLLTCAANGYRKVS